MLVAFLWPTLAMPYLGDDTFNAYLDGWIGYERLSLGEAFRQFFDATNVDVGRFYPIYPLLMFFDFHLVHQVVVLKALVLAAIVINAFSFYVLVRLIAQRFALPMLVLLPATLQIRFFHDPIVQFSLHMQLTFEFVILAAIALLAYSRSERIAYASASLAAYTLATLTYEVTYAFVVIYVVMMCRYIRRRTLRLRLGVAFVFVPLVCSSVALWFRSSIPVAATSPYAIHLDVLAILHAAWLQTVGALPFTYAAWNPSGFLPPIAIIWKTSPTAWAFAVLVFALALTIFAGHAPKCSAHDKWSAIGLGGLLLLASVPLIALSSRWQKELVPGLAYTPVYFEAFGVALLFAVLAVALIRTARRVPAIALVSAFAAVAGGTTYGANALTLAHYYLWSPIVPDGLDAGLLSDARDGDEVYLDDSYPAHARDDAGRWSTRYYLYAHTRKRLTAKHLAKLPRNAGIHAFALQASIADSSTGMAVGGRVVAVATIAGTNVPLVLSARRYEAVAGKAMLSTWRSHCGPTPLANVRDGVTSVLLVHYDAAFSFPESEHGVTFRWASGGGRVLVDNPSGSPRRANLALVVRPAGAAAHVRVRSGGQGLDRASTGADVPAKLTFLVPSRGESSVSVDSDNAPIPSGRGERILRYELRDVRIDEPACTTR